MENTKYSTLTNDELYIQYQEARKNFFRSELGTEQEKESEKVFKDISREVNNRNDFDLAMYKMESQMESLTVIQEQLVKQNKTDSNMKGVNNMKTIRGLIKSAVMVGVVTIMTVIPTMASEQPNNQPMNKKIVNIITESNNDFYVEKGDTITEHEDGTYTCINETINKYELYFPELGDWSINLNSQQEIKDVIEDSASHRQDLNDSINTVKDVKVINTYTKNDGSIVAEYNDYSWSLVNTNTNKFIFMPAITSDYEMNFKSESDLKDCIKNYISVRSNNNC